MKQGFTLIELVVTLGIFATLSAIGFVSFFSTYSRVNLSAATDVLIADVKTVQSNAMSGRGDSTWNLADSSVQDGVAITTTLPGNQLTFIHSSGEVSGYLTGQDSITLTAGEDSQTIRFNQYGTIIGD